MEITNHFVQFKKVCSHWLCSSLTFFSAKRLYHSLNVLHDVCLSVCSAYNEGKGDYRTDRHSAHVYISFHYTVYDLFQQLHSLLLHWVSAFSTDIPWYIVDVIPCFKVNLMHFCECEKVWLVGKFTGLFKTEHLSSYVSV